MFFKHTRFFRCTPALCPVSDTGWFPWTHTGKAEPKEDEMLRAVVLISVLVTSVFGMAQEGAEKASNRLTLRLRAVTIGPPWPPSEMMDENGDFIGIGSILEVPDGNGNYFFGPRRAVIISKETVPPLGPDGKEDFSRIFGAPHLVLRELDLSEGSPDLDMVLYSASFGPVVGDFNGGPRIPREGESTYNLNALPPVCPGLFPGVVQETSYTLPSVPLHEVPIWGFLGDNKRYDPDTGEAYPFPEPQVDVRPRTEPFRLRDWLRADEKSVLTVILSDFEPAVGGFTSARFRFRFRDLIPKGVYTLWSIRFNTLVPPPPGQDIQLPDSLCLPNVFVADDKGRASFECKVDNPFPSLATPAGFFRIVGIQVAFHPDYQYWGGCFARYGTGVDHSVHVASGLTAFDALETIAAE